MMSMKWLCLGLTMVFAVALGACSANPPAPSAQPQKPGAPAPTAEKPKVSIPAAAPAAPAAPAPVAAAPAAPAAAAPAAPAAPLDPLQQKLVGTSWKLGEIEAAFTDGSKVKLKGGPLKDIMPQGLDAKYTYERDPSGNGLITVSALGQTKKGTWDGEKLVMDGTAGVKQ